MEESLIYRTYDGPIVFASSPTSPAQLQLPIPVELCNALRKFSGKEFLTTLNDGNVFFRHMALIYWRDENKHYELRQAVIQCMHTDDPVLQWVLDELKIVQPDPFNQERLNHLARWGTPVTETMVFITAYFMKRNVEMWSQEMIKDGAGKGIPSKSYRCIGPPDGVFNSPRATDRYAAKKRFYRERYPIQVWKEPRSQQDKDQGMPPFEYRLIVKEKAHGPMQDLVAKRLTEWSSMDLECIKQLQTAGSSNTAPIIAAAISEHTETGISAAAAAAAMQSGE